MVQSELLESQDFDFMNSDFDAKVQEKKDEVTIQLSSIQKSIELAIRNENINMLKDFGANE